MNGFSAADMTTAAANGHRDGYQAGYADAVNAVEVGKPAAAQEAVAWFTWTRNKVSRRISEDREDLAQRAAKENADMDQRGVSECYRIVGPFPLYAAPVAAAPAVDVATLRALADRWATDRSYTGSPVDDIRALIEKPTASTPAAPGIDLEQFRESVIQEAARSVELWMKDEISNDAYAESKAKRDRLLALIDASPKGAVHPDDLAVDAFAAVMKAKLAEARAKGRGGWNGDEPDMQDRLSGMLRDHVEKGDPRDVANFCMFLHQRGEGISPKGGQEE